MSLSPFIEKAVLWIALCSMCLNTITPYQRMSNNAAGMIPIVRLGKDKLIFHALHHMTAITFLIIGIIIATCILFAFTLVLNKNYTAIAQQQQPTSISFHIDRFSNNPRGNTYILYL
jgi:hypothetical protein